MGAAGPGSTRSSGAGGNLGLNLKRWPSPAAVGGTGASAESTAGGGVTGIIAGVIAGAGNTSPTAGAASAGTSTSAGRIRGLRRKAGGGGFG